MDSGDDIWQRLKRKNDDSSNETRRPSQQHKRTRKGMPANRSAVSGRKNQKQTEKKEKLSLAAPLRQKSKSSRGSFAFRKPSAPQLNKKTVVVGSAAIVAVVGVVGGGLYINRTTSDTPQSLGVADQSLLPSNDTIFIEEVSFNPFFPSDFEERGVVFNFQRRNNDEIAFYRDAIAGTSFRVAQQVVPDAEEGSGGEAQIESIAKALPVPAENISRVDDTVFYYSDNEASEAQTVVFAKSGILFIVLADRHIDEMSWAVYIQSLIQ